MCDTFSEQDIQSLQLPKNSNANAHNTVLNVIGILRIAMLTVPPAVLRDQQRIGRGVFGLWVWEEFLGAAIGPRHTTATRPGPPPHQTFTTQPSPAS